MRPSRRPGVLMPDPTLMLVVADALVDRLRRRVERWAFDDAADQRLTVALLVDAEERLARLSGSPPAPDLPELRQRVRDLDQWQAEDAARPPRRKPSMPHATALLLVVAGAAAGAEPERISRPTSPLLPRRS